MMTSLEVVPKPLDLYTAVTKGAGDVKRREMLNKVHLRKAPLYWRLTQKCCLSSMREGLQPIFHSTVLAAR